MYTVLHELAFSSFSDLKFFKRDEIVKISIFFQRSSQL